MKFDVFNNDGVVVMTTSHISCIPNKDIINKMVKAGYKFKLDNKPINKMKLQEIIQSEVTTNN